LIWPDTGVLRYVSAGHNPALLLRRSGETARLDATGVPVGMFSSSTWKEETVAIAPGDLLCLYTDGLTEAANEAEEEFGMERLSTALAREGGRPVRQICDRIFADVADFALGMPQYDDQTLLLVRRT